MPDLTAMRGRTIPLKNIAFSAFFTPLVIGDLGATLMREDGFRHGRRSFRTS